MPKVPDSGKAGAVAESVEMPAEPDSGKIADLAEPEIADLAEPGAGKSELLAVPDSGATLPTVGSSTLARLVGFFLPPPKVVKTRKISSAINLHMPGG